MKPLLFLLACCIGLIPLHATTADLSQAEKNPAAVTELILNGNFTESARLIQLAPKLTALNTVVFNEFTDATQTMNAVSSVAACNHARTIIFRNCALQQLPGNLRMLTQIRTFVAEQTSVTDGEQFYNAIADMPNVENVTVTGNSFRMLPRSFARLRVMKNISLVNEDLQLANGYDLNTKTAEELISRDTVQFGFGADVLNLTYSCYNADACRSHLQMFRDVLQGAYRESNVFYAPASVRAFHKSHPLVKPPVKGMDVYPDVYSCNAMTGSTVKYGSGTKIIIPAMAFEDVNGSPVKGNVDITYREFRDPVDIVLSGIPMKYDSAGVSGDFRSAGMFEMNASQNGTEVFLREGKKVDIQFAVTDTAAEYNFYRLDEQNGWQYLSNPGKVESAAQTNLVKDSVSGNIEGSLNGDLTPAVSRYLEAVPRVARLRRPPDTTSLERRYADTMYFGDHKKYFGTNTTWKEKRKASSHLFLRKRASGDNYTIVSIEANRGFSNQKQELNVYNGCYWKIDGKMSGSQLSQKYGRKTGINDCRIINEGGEYFIELKFHWGYERLRAEPVTLNADKKPRALSEKRKKQLFDQYTRRLKRDQKEIDRSRLQLEKKVKRQETGMHRDSLRAWKSAQRVMNDEESAMTFEEFNAYAKAERIRSMAPLLNSEMNANAAVYQALSIEGMGIYNCDQIFRITRPREIIAKTIAVAGAVIVPVMVYIVDKVKNTVFTYAGGGGGVKATYSEDTRNYMLATDKDGNLYRSTDMQFEQRAEVGRNQFQFEAEQVPGRQPTPQSVRESIFGKPAE